MPHSPSHPSVPDRRGYFGPYGGTFVPETLISSLTALEAAYLKIAQSRGFKRKLNSLLKDTCGRPTALTLATRLSARLGAKIYLKREDLLHTGAHKINNALGQVLLAEKMGKTRIIAETGAGQHGVATATAAAMRGLACRVYMGAEDTKRQALNVYKMQLLGAEVIEVDSGSRTLKDAINEAIRDWISNVNSSHYVLGSVLGPHPYPLMVRNFQSVIGKEARTQIRKAEGRNPDRIVACVGGGSNAIGIFHAFLDRPEVELVGVEAGGRGPGVGDHAARFNGGRVGILHGTRTWVLQDANGQIGLTHSISAGMDYAAIGPEHAYYRDQGRTKYVQVGDDQVLEAFETLCRLEGIIPALESSHAVAYLLTDEGRPRRGEVVIVNLSGRGDKDVPTLHAEGWLAGRAPGGLA